MICDFAETYHLYDYKELPPDKVAVLLLGLRDNSRLKMHYSNMKLTIDQVIAAIMADNLQFLSWTKSKDARHGHYNKKSILKILQGEYDTEKDDLEKFSSVEDFDNYMKQFIK